MNQVNDKRTIPPIDGANRPSDGGSKEGLFAEIDSLVQSRAEALGEVLDPQIEMFADQQSGNQRQQRPVQPDTNDQPFGVVDFDGKTRQTGPRYESHQESQSYQQDQNQQPSQGDQNNQGQQPEQSNQMADMLNMMAQMMNQMQGGNGSNGNSQDFNLAQPVQPSNGQQPQQYYQQSIQSKRFLNEDDEIDASSINGAINKALNQYGNISDQVRQQITQDVMKSLAPSLAKFAQDQINLNMAVSNFYNENPDLRKYRDLVQWRTNIVHSSNPGQSVDQILKQVAKEVRQYVNPRQQQTRDNRESAGVQDTGRQNFASVPNGSTFSGGVRAPKGGNDGRTTKQKEMDELLNRRRR